MMVMVAACVLAPALGLGTSPAAGHPATNTVTPGPAGTVADDLALILRRLKVQFANPGDPHFQRETNYSLAQDYLSSMAKDGHWPDMEYEGERPGWNAHLGRLVQMAAAYASPASPDHHSAKMLERIECGLEYWVSNRQPEAHQWWQNTIGQPLELSRILVPLEDVLPAALLRAALKFYAFPSQIDPRYATGQNLVWYAQQQLISGALARSRRTLPPPARHCKGKSRLPPAKAFNRISVFTSTVRNSTTAGMATTSWSIPRNMPWSWQEPGTLSRMKSWRCSPISC